MRNRRPSARDLGLHSDSFVSIDDLDMIGVRSAVVNVEALQKVGKTDFCLRHTPGPIVIFNFDQGLKGVVEKFAAKKQIMVAGMPGSGREVNGKVVTYPSYNFARPMPQKGENRRSSTYVERVQKAALPVWERFIIDLNEFYESDARTGVIDTGKAAYSLGKFAFIGMDRTTSKDDPYGQKSGNLNAIFQGLITDGQNYDKNVLWVHRIKEEWKGGQPSGRYKTDGYSQVGFEVQTTIRLKRDRAGELVAEVRDCRFEREMNGEEFAGKLARWPTIMAAVTGTDEEVWE